MRCEFGYCLSCDKELAHSCPTCSTRKPNEHYTEIEMKWSNGSRIKLAVCVDCAPEKVWKLDKKEVTQAIHSAYDKVGYEYNKEVSIV